jgi:DNA-binding transcriptional MerR regulator
LVDYRIGDLARVSGVTSRNIRAYRERGLLDPPRRQGRTAWYDDHHLSQLSIINQLLSKGFTSSHIADFFEGMRKGETLADILGLQQAVLDVWQTGAPADAGPAETAQPVRIDIDPAGDEADRLRQAGLAEVTPDGVMLDDPTIAAIVARAPDQALYVRAVLEVFASTRAPIDDIAARVVAVLERNALSLYGTGYVPGAGFLPELTGVVQDYRELGGRVVARQLDVALQQQVLRVLSDYTVQLMVRGHPGERDER